MLAIYPFIRPLILYEIFYNLLVAYWWWDFCCVLCFLLVKFDSVHCINKNLNFKKLELVICAWYPISNTSCWLINWTFAAKTSSHECHRTSLIITQCLVLAVAPCCQTPSHFPNQVLQLLCNGGFFRAATCFWLDYDGLAHKVLT